MKFKTVVHHRWGNNLRMQRPLRAGFSTRSAGTWANRAHVSSMSVSRRRVATYAAGAAGIYGGYRVVKHVKQRRQARKAGHNYQNKPPQLTRQQRQQMARRRRRVRGRFA
jgi:hypothetical protein